MGMWILSICLSAGYPCVDRIKEGTFDSAYECLKVGGPILERTQRKTEKKLIVVCREMLISAK